MARSLTPPDYGVLAVLISIIYIFNVPSTPTQIFSSNATTKFYSQKEFGKIKGIFKSLLTNFFYTTLKLKEKKRIGSKVTKAYEEARTPYQRLLETDKISKEIKDKLIKKYKRLNPAQLQRSLIRKLEKIKKYSLVT